MVLLGLFANILSGGALIPQLYKTIKTKHIKDMSYLWLLLSLLANILWIIYGATEAKWEIAIMGIMFTSFYGFHVYMKHRTEEDPYH